jgi:hypothetical protein
MTITLHLLGHLRSKRNRRLINKLLAQGFNLVIAR